jgi:hypothetical protein
VQNPFSDLVSSRLFVGRRRFLRQAGHATVATTIAGAIGAPDALVLAHALAPNKALDSSSVRAKLAYQVRVTAALRHSKIPLPLQPNNGDEDKYLSRVASYSKALPHNRLGEVYPDAYDAMLHALVTANASDFEKIPIVGVVKQGNPQAAFAFDLEGSDSHQLGMAPPPAFSSPEEAGEMVELYWQALTRDIPFSDYENDSTINYAAHELTRLSGFKGPRRGDRVVPSTLFRGVDAASLVGPYVSQFLWQDIPYPATGIAQRIHTGDAGIDYLTGYDQWLAIQNGAIASELQWNALTPRYVRNGRDLAEYVHNDYPYQHYLNACLVLLSYGNAALDPNNPYRKSQNQTGFSTFGAPQVLGLVATVANCGLNCAWYQKWLVHRRLRPEEFGGRIHNHRTRAADYPINGEVLNSEALDRVFTRYGTYLLPMAFPEGCPTHPAYPAGHAVIAGACVTALKAFFDESFVIRRPVEASADGLSLVPYKGPELTVGGELNKLASNVAIGRNTAGLHWRSDAFEGLKLGETVALSVMSDMKQCFNEEFNGFGLTKFDGTAIVI